ncbi:sodium/proton antiporter NhaB [Paucidesulfovibrio longus]|uniref:sodium/proton antiporter NhaB n=1 Tax=Paucidesulfovibrio longus TaxID=889 RepID=UPI0003B3F845|nr:sodium/proton antiporter NhaB [Paucidesulfovibrio longus]
MPKTIAQALQRNLLGNAPTWYKLCIIGFLILNPILLQVAGPFVTGWVLICEFIFTLAMALKCYPLPAGGLLAIEAVFLGMTSPETVYHEALNNFPVILLLIFMVAGIHFMKELLQFTFTKLLVKIQSKIAISLLFCFAGAFLSAFLDALTVTAVIIAVAYGFYNVYHRYASGVAAKGGHDLLNDEAVKEMAREDLKEFRGYLRNLMMHGAVGTALGGVCTLVGEPQNLLIASEMGWHFVEFFVYVAPISMPVLIVGLLTCVAVEKFHIFGYGHFLPGNVRSVLLEEATRSEEALGLAGKARLLIQACAAIWLILALALHLAEVGIIGLSIIVLLTALNGVIEENRIGKAFEEALPFTALLVVFFAIVAVIHDQHLFKGIINFVLSLQGKQQLAAYYLANGLLSMISDNVFVATVYISETKMHFTEVMGAVPGVTMSGHDIMAGLTDYKVNSHEFLAQFPQAAAQQLVAIKEQFNALAVAINTGTNIPSVATPNGQAAFLFLLTSALAPVIRLSYMRMVMLALPYTITMSIAGLTATWYMPEIEHWLVSVLHFSGH